MIKQVAFLFLIASILVACGPISKFVYTTEQTTAPAEVTFENQSEKAEAYLWDFGDGNTSTDTMPAHRYIASGNYEVTLEAKKGKQSKISKQRIVINPPQKCLVQLETSYGNMLIELFDSTPKHRDNFIKLAEEGFYNGLLFHRIIEGFMIQGGDPQSKNAKPGQSLGMGGPGYQVDAEISPENVHLKGALAAARQGDQVNPERKSSGSQFYIVQGNPVPENMLSMMEKRSGMKYSEEQKNAYTEIGGTPQLDGAYTVFGQVLEGMDVIDSISVAPRDRRDRPEQNIEMKVTVIK